MERQSRDRDDSEELVMFLERDQLVVDRERPLAQAALGRRSQAALWSLRVFVIVVGLMVIYTFLAKL